MNGIEQIGASVEKIINEAWGRLPKDTGPAGGWGKGNRLLPRQRLSNALRVMT